MNDGDSKTKEIAKAKAANRNQGTNGCLAILPCFYSLWMAMWESFHRRIEESGAPEIVRLLFSGPLVAALCFLALTFFITSFAKTPHKPARIWQACCVLFWLGFVGYIWDNYGDAGTFQAYTRVNMTDNPMEELLAAGVLALLLVFIGFRYGVCCSREIKKGDPSQELLVKWAFLCGVGSIVASSYFFALYWPWPYMTGEVQNRWIAISPYSVPVDSGIAAAMALLYAYRVEMKVEPQPEHMVTLRVTGPRDAIDVSYSIRLRRRIAQSKRAIVLLPWEWHVPVHKGTYVSVQADPQRLAGRQSDPVSIQLLVDEKVVRENWATGQVVECHVVV